MTSWEGDEIAEYWNQNAKEYIFGINKVRDYKKAEDNFVKAAHMGSNNA